MPFSQEEIEEAYQQATSESSNLKRELFFGILNDGEQFWVDIQPFLLSRGYRLRPRYDPEWTPPWLLGSTINTDVYDFEEALSLFNGRHLIDAVRVSDGYRVVLKSIDTSREEIPVAQFLSTPELRSDPRNHTVPILDMVLLPNDDSRALLVMPQLLHFNTLPFLYLKEFTDAVRQFLEGLDFMHQHNTIHGDACYFNLMVDPSKLVPRGVHFIKPRTHDGLTRGLEWNARSSVGPLKYYFIDFGLSAHYLPGQDIMFEGPYGQDRTVPEHSLPEPYDSFKVDIFQLGNVIKRMIDEYDGLEPLLPIALGMTRKNPQDRMSLREALERLDQVPKKVLKRRVWKQTTPTDIRFVVQFCCANPTACWVL
ncbi:hypothetical protein D9615_009783 [Tricholomella constricta]|uniref:Protein kinase domain-containing protein n=1 Tax=Tricholomella constricta TaxID=117010 RepID=A0A8H5GTT1_9AGAR|nr:hypothetical protein D9615_009783 [Tricholomella constricta]